MFASPRASHTKAVVPVGVLVLALAGFGCAGLKGFLGFKEQAQQARFQARVAGDLTSEGPSVGTLVVVIGRLAEGDKLVGVDSYVRTNPGSYAFLVSPGRYQLGAYEDRNQNGLLDPGERAGRIRDSPIVELEPGDRTTLDLHLPADAVLPEVTEPVDVLGIIERTPREQREFSLWALSVQGEVCDDLDSERFGPAAGRNGLWKPMDFLNDELAGIYFLEPYDGRRVPVLFVHGISGYPQEFSTLIDSLDRTRFQPWFYFYPSAFPLDGIASHLATLLERLQLQYGFDEIAIVAHSMGGLVSRGAILKYASETERNDVRLFVSISTPWGGDVNATRAEGAPVELPASFKDMDPSSEYLRWIFYEGEGKEVPKRLPRGAAHHLIFGFGGSGAVCNDDTVTCASEARQEAQAQAMSVRALDYRHVDILRSPEVVARLNRLLDDRF
jgi:pimeloyl-ACP methyl ester carboxylesterase